MDPKDTGDLEDSKMSGNRWATGSYEIALAHGVSHCVRSSSNSDRALESQGGQYGRPW